MKRTGWGGPNRFPVPLGCGFQTKPTEIAVTAKEQIVNGSTLCKQDESGKHY